MKRRSLHSASASPALAAVLAVGVACGVLAAAGLLFWADLDAEGRQAFARTLATDRIAMVGLILALGLAGLAVAAYRATAMPARDFARLADGTRLAACTNPAHRLGRTGHGPADALAEAIDLLAERRSALMADAGALAQRARTDVEAERNRFAALIDELDQSVLVCNREGRILLYNGAVQELLGQAIGLGRSAFGAVDRHLVLHALEALEGTAAQGERGSAQFVMTTRDGRLLRVNVAPVLAPPPEAGSGLAGFVLLFTDVTQNIETDTRSMAAYQALVQATRGSIAAIGAAMESLSAQPDLDAQGRRQIAAGVQAEATRLSEKLDTLGADVAARLRERWPLAEIRGTDLLALAARRMERVTGTAARVDPVEAGLWVRVDSFSLVQAVTSLAARLKEEFAVRDLRLRLTAAAPRAHLDLVWRGVPMSSETAYTWQSDVYTLGGEDSPLSLAQVMERHGGEAWYQRDTPSQSNYFRLALPLAAARQRAAAHAPLPGAARPEFYDFDLFDHSPAVDALDERPLDELTYTVFDTETTGLSPQDGDQIISLGAVRIVNRRVLRSETFEELVDPRHPVSAASTEIHGITADMLVGKPTIDRVLPRLHRFAEESVLVAHNAAFDMRFVQLQEARAGVRFDQPVLDTLLLAAVVHPSAESQSLESIAGRLGIAVLGRHTALGDALATADVFLALLPLLAQMGIRTLGEARAASERTYYARLKY